MKKLSKPARFIYSLLLLSSFLFFGRAQAQIPFVVADPALVSFDITTMAGVPVNANTLVGNFPYKLKLIAQNVSQANAIPAATAEIRIGLGNKMILAPGFDISTAPFSNYFTWTYSTSGNQPQISGLLHTALPAGFIEELSFDVKATTQGNSTFSGNFLVVNLNPNIILTDPTNNNIASLNYIVASQGTLPVTITRFAALNKDCKIQVSWKSEQEVNLSRYEIEASKDGINFFTVGELPAQGNRDYQQSFDLTSALRIPVLLVRLKTTDLDGSYRYSNVVSVSGTCKGNAQQIFFAYPNPVRATDHLTLAAKGEQFDGTYRLTVTDVAGRVYSVKEVTLNAPSLRVDLSPSLAAGKYFISILKTDGLVKSVVQFEKL